jgi:hypothetical protein
MYVGAGLVAGLTRSTQEHVEVILMHGALGCRMTRSGMPPAARQRSVRSAVVVATSGMCSTSEARGRRRWQPARARAGCRHGHRKRPQPLRA